jgi:hypothetical protein
MSNPFADNVRKMAAVGSRVTCDPAPVDTDEDILILCDSLTRLYAACASNGYTFDGDGKYIVEDGIDPRFISIRRGNTNLICTEDPEFFDKFVLATSVCKKLNVLKKLDRVTVFQAILYQKEA